MFNVVMCVGEVMEMRMIWKVMSDVGVEVNEVVYIVFVKGEF